MMGGFGGSMGGAGLGGGKSKRPIGVKFEIPYFTTSGIQVRYLKIIEPKVSWMPFLFGWRGGFADLRCAVAISVPAVGAVYYPERRYRCALAGCAMMRWSCCFELCCTLSDERYGCYGMNNIHKITASPSPVHRC